jgi:hypothetical protein
MNVEFDKVEETKLQNSDDLRLDPSDTVNGMDDSQCDAEWCSTDGLDNLKRDRFELLSAYLDGEVTPEERSMVEAWLEHDPQIQTLHRRLLMLRQELDALPVPERDTASVESTLEAVLGRVERRRSRILQAWGGVAIAAMFIGGVTATVTQLRQSYQMAHSVAEVSKTIGYGMVVSGDSLMLALDHPIIEIPTVKPPTSEKEGKTFGEQNSKPD